MLITSANLKQRGGSTLYIRDVAQSMLRKGHRPVVYSTELGEVARELRSLTIPVVSNLNDLAEAPDIIHGQSQRETMAALLHFPHVPAIDVCHGWMNSPLHFPRVLRYVAVDQVCYDRLVLESGVPPEKVQLVLNFADLDRFKARLPLPEMPETALIFSNGIAPGRGLEAIREACTRAGLTLDAIGYGAGASTDRPEDVLPKYDIVFAKARCAIEALSVGCAVVVSDVAGLAGMVTSENLDTLRRLNFGWRSLANSLEPASIYDEIRAYSAKDAARVSKKMRDTASLQRTVGELVSIYESVIKEYRRSKPDLAVEMRAASTFVAASDIGVEIADASSILTVSAPPPAAVLGAPSDNVVLTPLQSIPFEAIELVSGHVEPDKARRRSTRKRAADDVTEEVEKLVRPALRLRTSAIPWHYAAVLRVGDYVAEEMQSRSGVVRLRLRVSDAPVGIGLHDQGNVNFATRQAFEPNPNAFDLLLRVARFDQVGTLVIQTWDQPAAALVEIETVEVCVTGTV